MKKIRKILFILVAFFAFFLVGASKVDAASYNTSVSINDSEGGSVTSSHPTKCNITLVIFADTVTVSVSWNEGYMFWGWYDSNDKLVSGSASYSFSCNKTASKNTFRAKVVKIEDSTVAIDRDGVSYNSLSEALANAQSDIALLKDDELRVGETANNTYVVPSNISLILPYQRYGWAHTEIGTKATATGVLSWFTPEGISNYRVVQLKVHEGVTLVVNGTLVIGAIQHYPDQKFSQGITSGNYSEVNNSGNITVNGMVYCYGLLSGNGRITMESGSKLYQPMVINDYAGGTNTTYYVGAKEMPFRQFAMVNIHCIQVYKYGSEAVGISSVYASSSINIAESPMIGNGVNGHVFSMETAETYVELSYNPDLAIKDKLGNISVAHCGVLNISVYGHVKLGEFSVQSYNSKSLGYFGLPYTFHMIVNNGALLEILNGYSYKMMPGSKLVINEGGKLLINNGGNLVVYDALIQGAKSGKVYPDSQILKDNGFTPNAEFIVNGELEINGLFAGIVQTNSINAVIKVGASATLYKSVSDGITKAADGEYKDNQTVFDLYARVYGVNGYIYLEKSKIYKGFDVKSFILESFTANDIGAYEAVMDKTVQLNQPMNGRFLEWDGGKYHTILPFYIGESLGKDGLVVVVIDDIENPVKSDGCFEAKVSFEKNGNVYYYTSEKENENTYHYFVVIISQVEDIGYIQLDSIVKSVSISEFEYTKFDDEELPNINALVSFYGTKEDILINTKNVDLDPNKIINEIDLEHEDDIYIIENNTITVTNIPRALQVYNGDVLLLEESTDLLHDAISLWARYEGFLSGRNNNDIKFINGYVDYSYGAEIVKDIGTISNLTYGDSKTNSNGIAIDGSNISIELSVSNWKSDPSLSADVKYNGLYKDKVSYTHETTIKSNIDSKEIELVINEADENNEIHTLYKTSKDITISLKSGSALLLGEELENVVEVSREQGSNAKAYDINIRVIHIGYSISNLEELKLVKYIIDPIPVSIVVSDYDIIRDDRVGRNMNITKEVVLTGELDTPITYKIEDSENVEVARVDKDGKVTILNKEKYVAGNYKIVPVIDSDNYVVTPSSGNLTVIAKYDYYSVNVEIEDEELKSKYDYTANEYNLSVSINLNVGSMAQVNDYTATINTVDINSVVIKDAKIYNLIIIVDEVDYSFTFEIEKRVLEFVSNAPAYYTYNSQKQVPEITITNLLLTDNVILDLQTPNSVNAGNYSIKVIGLKDGSNSNYRLPDNEELLSFEYEIKKLDVSIDVNDHSTIRNDRITEKMNISKVVTINGNLDTSITYVIKDSENVEVAKVDKDGIVFMSNADRYIVGIYTIIPVIDSNNYDLSYTVGHFSVVDKYDYYSVTVKINDEELKEKYDYIATTYDLIVTVNLNVDSKEAISDYSVKINAIDISLAIIKDAKVYNVLVTVDHVEYNYSFEIEKRVIELESDAPEFYVYNGELQAPNITITNLLLTDSVRLDLNTPSSINVGNYVVEVVALTSDSNINYVLPSDINLLKFAYEIKELSVTIDVKDHSNIMDLYKNELLRFEVETNLPTKFSSLIQYIIKDTLDNEIARVIDGSIIVNDGKTYGVGEYKVYAYIDSSNFIVTGDYGNLEIVENNEYYKVDVKYYDIYDNNITTYVYDGNNVRVEVKVYLNDGTNTLVDDYVYLVNGNSISEFSDANTYKVNVTIEDYSYGDVSSFTISKRVIELTNNITQYTYNGEEYSPKVSITNLVNGDIVELDINYPSSINAGTYTIEVKGIKESSNPNYILPTAQSSLSFTYTIDKLPISISVEDMYPIRESKVTSKMNINKTITLDGDFDSTITYLIKNSITKIVVAYVDEKGNVTLTGNVNYYPSSYIIEPRVNSNNYDLTYEVGNFEVIKDVEYFNVEAKINGNDINERYEYTSEELIFTSSVNIINPNTPVDEYNVMVNGIDLDEAIIKDSGDYKIIINVDGAKYEYSFTITKVVLELTINSDMFIYNGESQSPTVSATNLKGDDSLSFITDISTSIDVGTYSVKVTGIRNRTHLNYELPTLEDELVFDYKIDPKPVEIVMGNHDQIRVGKVGSNISFDKSISELNGLNPNVSYEIRNSENEIVAKVSSDGSVTFEEGMSYGVGEYSIHPVIHSQNYVLTYETSTLVVVEDTQYYLVDVYVNDELLESSYVYDGTNFELEVEVNIANPIQKVNEYKVLVNQNSIEDITIRNVDAYNVIVNVDGVIYNFDFDIIEKEISYTIDTNVFVYDGELHAPTFTLVGTIKDDEVSVSSLSNNRYKGEYTITGTLVGEDAKNYKLSRPLSVDYEILPMPITVRINNVSSIYGNAIAAITFICNDTLAKGDNIYSFIKLSKEEGLDVGYYDIITTNTNENYDVTFENTIDSYEIQKRSIIVAVDSKSLTYGDPVEPLTATLSYGQFAYDDTLESIVTLTREDTNNAGVYSITAVNNSNNYSIEFANGTYTINQRRLSVFIDDYLTMYGEGLEKVEIEIIEGSLAYDHKIEDLLVFDNEVEETVGVYILSVTKVYNTNYNIKVNYTKLHNSIYEVTKRPIIINANSASLENDATYDEVISAVRYDITSGNIVYGDDLNINLSIILQNGTTLTRENFDINFGGGEHSIVVTAYNSNYDIQITNGILTVTRRIVSIEGIQTEYVYTGEEIVVFNWEENITNYDLLATDKSFDYVIYVKDENGNYIEVDSVINASEYRIIINIVHTHAYEFQEGTKTTYDIVVNKKDIADEVFIYNIPANNTSIYNALGFTLGVELPIEYEYVEYTETLLWNGNEVYEAKDVGKYTYIVTINNINYSGTVSVNFTITKKDISQNILINILPDQLLINDELHLIDIRVNNYDVDTIITYTKVNNPNNVLSSINETGNYIMKVSIDDDNYMGSRSIQIMVAKNVKAKIERLNQLKEAFDASNNDLEKIRIMNESNLILDTLDSYDLAQIDTNDTYKDTISDISSSYDAYNAYLEELNSAKDKDNLIWIIIISVSAIIILIGVIVLIVILKRKKA